MLPTPSKRSSSVYDNIPNLESWYATKDDEPLNQIVPCHKKRNSPLATVSFSAEPPAVYHYENMERPIHRRTSSSEHCKLYCFCYCIHIYLYAFFPLFFLKKKIVKEFLKHYTSKLSKQLSHRSQRA